MLSIPKSIRRHKARPPPPPLAVAILESALIQLKNGRLPVVISCSLFSDPNPVDCPILAAPPDGKLNFNPSN